MFQYYERASETSMRPCLKNVQRSSKHCLTMKTCNKNFHIPSWMMNFHSLHSNVQQKAIYKLIFVKSRCLHEVIIKGLFTAI